MKYKKNNQILTAIVKIDNINKMFFASKIQSNKKNDCDGCYARKQSRKFCIELHKALTDNGFPDCNRGWAYKVRQTIEPNTKKRITKFKNGGCDFKNGEKCNIPANKHCADRIRKSYPENGNVCGAVK